MVNPEHTHRRFLSLMAQVAFVLAACLLHSPTAAFADIFAGSVSGVVKDAASGQGIEGVTVYVKKAGTTMVTASTNSLGQYKGSISSTGNYGVEVEKEGYETSFPPSVPVQVSDSSPDIVWPEILMIKSDTPLAHLTVSPPSSPLLFADKDLNTSGYQTKTLTVASTGAIDLVTGTAVLSDTTNYSIVADTCSGQTIPCTGQGTCQIGVRFNPTTTGSKQATLTIPSNTGHWNATVGKQTILILSGTAIRTRPATPVNSAPTDREATVSLTPQLAASAFLDVEGITHASSTWEIATDRNFAGGPVFTSRKDARNLTSITVPPGIVRPDSTYCWRVAYTDGAGVSSLQSIPTCFKTPSVKMNESGVTPDATAVKSGEAEIKRLSDIIPAVGNVSSKLVADFAEVNCGTSADTTKPGVAIVKGKGGIDRDILGIATPPGTIIDTVTTTVPTDTAFKTAPPPAYTFPHGVVSFRLSGVTPGSSVPVTLYTPTDLPADAVWCKYVAALGWLTISSRGTYTADGTLVSSNTTFAVDNGKGILTIRDDDVTDASPEVVAGKAVVLDPGAPAIPVTAATPAAPSTSSDGGGGGGGGCFIATAAFGSCLDPHVGVLRGFRDRFLMTTGAGRSFVQWYYRVSPPFASAVADKIVLKAALRAALFPAVGFSALCLKIGLFPAVLMLLIAVAMVVVIVRMNRTKYCQSTHEKVHER